MNATKLSIGLVVASFVLTFATVRLTADVENSECLDGVDVRVCEFPAGGCWNDKSSGHCKNPKGETVAYKSSQTGAPNSVIIWECMPPGVSPGKTCKTTPKTDTQCGTYFYAEQNCTDEWICRSLSPLTKDSCK